MACLRVSDVVDLLEDEAALSWSWPDPGSSPGLAWPASKCCTTTARNLVLVLAFTRRPSAAMRDIVRAGAVDMIQLPADDVRFCRRRWTVHSGSRFAARAQAGQSRLCRLTLRRVNRHAVAARVVTLASATGGCGKTFLATNLAYLLARQPGHRVCIVDLDLQFGEVSTALHLRPRYTICDALERRGRRRRPQPRASRTTWCATSPASPCSPRRVIRPKRIASSRRTSPASCRPCATTSTPSSSTRRPTSPRSCSPRSTCPTRSTPSPRWTFRACATWACSSPRWTA